MLINIINAIDVWSSCCFVVYQDEATFFRSRLCPTVAERRTKYANWWVMWIKWITLKFGPAVSYRPH